MAWTPAWAPASGLPAQPLADRLPRPRAELPGALHRRLQQHRPQHRPLVVLQQHSCRHRIGGGRSVWRHRRRRRPLRHSAPSCAVPHCAAPTCNRLHHAVLALRQGLH